MRPEPVKPQTNGYGPKKLEEDAYPIAVEGTVICKSGSEYVPIKGAVVRITCWGVEEKEEGYNSYKAAPLAWKTRPTDANGYFFKTLHSNSVQNFVEKCKAYIERSPMKNCSAASDVNKGITGSPLSSYRILHDKRIKLYPVGPFFYTPSYQSPKSTPAGY
ncbi:Protein SEED AND ROOT HAIR PROTECTIVE PROTEIN [Linum grandiflorum]